MSIIRLVTCALIATACGSSKPAASPPADPAPEPAPADPAAPPPAAGTCQAAGGSCVPLTATVACKSKPEGTCDEGQYCCEM